MATPGKVVDVDEKLVEILGNQKKVKFAIPNLKKGDYVLIHAGVAVEKLSKKDYEEMVSATTFEV